MLTGKSLSAEGLTNYEAVIIGSGLGGLSRGDFTFDVGLHMVDGVGKGETIPATWNPPAPAGGGMQESHGRSRC